VDGLEDYPLSPQDARVSGNWHIAPIEVKGNILSAYLDDALLSTTTYTQLPPGGVVGVQRASNQKVFIDYLTASPLE
jgi:hypothetical protein